MTELLVLAQATYSLNLLTGTIRATDDWRPTIQSTQSTIVETIPVYISGTEAEIITATKTFERIIVAARRYVADQLEKYPAWLQFAPEDRSGVQTSTIVDGSLTINNNPGDSSYMSPARFTGTITLTRLNTWESATATVLNSVDAGNHGSQTSISSHDSPLDSRIPYCLLSVNTDDYENIYIGIRRERQGLTNFMSQMEVEDAFDITGDTADESLAGTSGGYCKKTTFASGTSLMHRWSLRLSSTGLSSTYQYEMTGRYLVLVRAQLTAAGTVGMQLKTGYWATPTAALTALPEVYITNTAWQLVPLGVIQLPPHATSYGQLNKLLMYTFFMYAEQLTGTPSLRVDSLILIPTDHMAIIRGASLTSTSPLVLATRHIGEPYAINKDNSGNYNQTVETSFENWFIPDGNSTMVVAAEGASGHSLTADDITFYLTSNPRTSIFT